MPKKDEEIKAEELTTSTEKTGVDEELNQANSEDSTVAEKIEENQTSEDFSEIKIDNVSKNEVENEEDENGTVTVQPVKFASFEDSASAQGEDNKNLDILMDIKLNMTVELGRTEMPIKKVLELTRGSIVELQKIAGEPVDLYANGKLIAHGEVVVIEDNFGLRIISITDPEDRIKGISQNKQ